MIELKVLGIGSPFGMDQLGWEVIKTLQEDPSLLQYQASQLHLAYHDRPGIGLLELMSQTQTVFLVDAMVGDCGDFQLHCLEDDALEQIEQATSSHQLGVAEVIQIGKVLDCLPEKIKFYGIEVPAIEKKLQSPEALKPLILQLSKTIIEAIHAHFHSFKTS